jgi:hypothetical protein
MLDRIMAETIRSPDLELDLDGMNWDDMNMGYNP